MNSALLQFLSIMNEYELQFYLNFLKVHEDKTPSEKLLLLESEDPELYDKLIKIGGNLNGSKQI